MAGERRVMDAAVLASIAVHVVILGLARLPARADEPVPPPVTATAPDSWAGTTADLAGERLYDVNVETGSQPSAPAPASESAPASAPEHEPAPAPAPAPKPEPKPVPVPKPATAPEPKPATAPEPKPAPTPKPAPVAATEPAPASASASARVAEAPRSEPARAPRARPRRAASGEPSATKDDPAGGSGDPRPGSFGAAGTASVRDLGRAFTRAIPPACQADPVWGTLAIGDAGTIEIAITIDETGHITGFEPSGDHAPPQLVNLVKRTLALLKAGTFAITSGAVSAGTEVLRIRAVTSDVAEAEDNGGAAGLSFAYDGRKGKAAFTQAGGRHVELSVEVLRVTAGG